MNMFLTISTGKFDTLSYCKNLLKLPNKVWKFNFGSFPESKNFAEIAFLLYHRYYITLRLATQRLC